MTATPFRFQPQKVRRYCIDYPWVTHFKCVDSIYKSHGFFIEETESIVKSCGFSSQDIKPANSVRNKSLLYTWLRNCCEEHPQCRRSFSTNKLELDEKMDEIQPLPTRLVEVGQNNSNIKLVLTAGRKGSYVALSHRWGAQKNLRTLDKNLEKHLKKIKVEDLSKTFKDAIEVTRGLGAHYLWIDSLCIIQDNLDDWTFEATQMGKIFEQASCTIAAIDAIADSTGIDRGLFLPREEDPLTVRFYCAPQKDAVEPERFRSKDGQPYCWKYTYYSYPKQSSDSANEDLLEQHRLVAKPRLLGSPWEIMRSKWNWRGWILQERILSRRIIYFSKAKLSWDCLTTSGEEELLGIAAPPLRSGIRSWNTLTEQYTKCSLTYESDKLAAISGLAERLGKKINQLYFAGIFQDPAGNGLMWRSDSNDPMTRLVSFHAPTWTWAAYNGAITYDLGVNIGMSESLCEISKPDFCIKYSCPNMCSNVSRTCVTGSIKWVGMIGTAIRADTLCSLNLSSDKDLIEILGSDVHWEPRPTVRIVGGIPEEIPRKLSIPDRVEVLKDEKGGTIGWILLDTDIPRVFEAPLFLAVIRRWRRTARPSASLGLIQGFDYMSEEYVDALALKECDERPRTYERIGVGRIIDKSWIRCCAIKTIEVW